MQDSDAFLKMQCEYNISFVNCIFMTQVCYVTKHDDTLILQLTQELLSQNYSFVLIGFPSEQFTGASQKKVRLNTNMCLLIQHPAWPHHYPLYTTGPNTHGPHTGGDSTPIHCLPYSDTYAGRRGYPASPPAYKSCPGGDYITKSSSIVIST